MKKRVFHTETAYAAGLALLALGTAFSKAADLGMSVVVAPAYVLYLKISETLPFFTFGMAEYVFQAALLAVMACVLKRFRARYLLSFATAALYGVMLDACVAAVGMIPAGGTAARAALFAAGLVFCAAGVSLFFHTYLPPEVYELFVREVSEARGADIGRFKTCYDLSSGVLAAAMSLALFGRLEGVKLGTAAGALTNGWLVGRCSAFFERRFVFEDAFRDKKLFPEE